MAQDGRHREKVGRQNEPIFFDGSYSYRKLNVLFSGLVLASLSLYALFMAVAIAEHQRSTANPRWLINSAFIGIIGALFLMGGLLLLYRFFTRLELVLVVSQQGISYGKIFCPWQDVRSFGSTVNDVGYQLYYQTKRSSRRHRMPVDMGPTKAGYDQLVALLQKKVLPQYPTLIIGSNEFI